MAVVEVTDLVKRYKDVTAVDGVTFSIAEGEVFALLGPNGAGKSSTVEILEGHKVRTSGSVSVLGIDPADGGRSLRERVGIVLQKTAVEEALTVKEAIDLYGGMYPKRRPTAELIEIVGLEEKTRARIKSLSGGQRRRLELALGIVGDPEMLFLDEPTTGFDPSARRQAWTVIDNLRRLGKTILLTTHYMDEAQNLSDRVAIIANGRFVAEGTPETLGGRELASSVVRFTLDGATAVVDLPAGLPGLDLGPAGSITLSTMDPTAVLHTLTSWALERGVALHGLTVSRPTLEDIYLELTSGEVGDG